MKLTAFVGCGLIVLGLGAVVAMRQPVAAQEVLGGQSTANMVVTANVIRKCTVTTQPLAFGSYDPVQANYTAALDGQTTMSVACTKGTTVAVAMDGGSNVSGTARRMASGTNFLGYEIYKDSARTEVWTDTAGGVFNGGVAPTRDPRQFTVYGRVAGGQDAAEGAFQDTVLVTVQF